MEFGLERDDEAHNFDINDSKWIDYTDSISDIYVVKDELLWGWAVLRNDAKTYRLYLKVEGEAGKHYKDARILYEDKRWEKAMTGSSIKDLELYIWEFPRGKHLTEAKQILLDVYVFIEVVEQNGTPSAYENYLGNFSGGISKQQSERMIRNLECIQVSNNYWGAEYVPWRSNWRIHPSIQGILVSVVPLSGDAKDIFEGYTGCDVFTAQPIPEWARWANAIAPAIGFFGKSFTITGDYLDGLENMAIKVSK